MHVPSWRREKATEETTGYSLTKTTMLNSIFAQYQTVNQSIIDVLKQKLPGGKSFSQSLHSTNAST